MIMPFYNGGYKDLPDTTTPISAAAMNFAEAPKLLGGGLLINGNFDIWQRGTSFTGSGYTADRWEAFVGNPIINRVVNPFPTNAKYALEYNFNSTSTTLQQQIENPNNVLLNKEITFSAWLVSDIPVTCVIRLRNETLGVNIQDKGISITTTPTQFTFTYNASASWNVDDIILLRLFSSISDNSATITVGQVKFEVGEVATEFIPKTEAEELRDCQRYYQRLQATSGTIQPYYGNGQAYSTTRALIVIPIFVPLRITPTIAISALSLTTAVGGLTPVTALSPTQSCSNVIKIDVTSSGIVAGNATMLLGDSASYVELDAEL